MNDERKQLADVLNELLIGNLSYVELADRLVSKRSSNREICDFLYEFSENDLEPYKLIKLTEEQHGMIERCIIFLRSKTNYQWPDYPRQGPLNALSFVLLYVGAPAAIVWFIIHVFISYSAMLWILAIPGLGLMVCTFRNFL
jgi:hypothetical protein